MNLRQDFNRSVIIASVWDPRLTSAALDGDDDGERDIEFPAVVEVCSRCGGKGRHSNPSIDGNGITGEEMDELGDDFREDYFSGVYDVQCEQCNGRNVTLEIDETRANKADLAIYWSNVDADRAYAAEVAAERRMGY